MCVPLVTDRVTIPQWYQATYMRLYEAICNRTNVLCFVPRYILHLCIVFHRKTSSPLKLCAFFPAKWLSRPMRDARNTALCVTRRLAFNYKFVSKVTALVHRNWNVTNLRCVCRTAGEKPVFSLVSHTIYES